MRQTASYTDKGGRAVNEDCVRTVEKEGALCLLLADGLGGHGGGDLASRTAADVVCGGWQGEAEASALRELVVEAHEAVQALQKGRCAMKTTLVALLLDGGRAVWAHAGDSRLYGFWNGRMAFQTLDHSVAQMGVVLGEITPEQIRFHEDRNRVLRALGQEGSLKIETGERTLEPGRWAFLLCSDGFWEYVLENEMEEALAQADGPEEWLARMRDRMSGRVPPDHDNNSAAAAWLGVDDGRGGV